jgi:hypothetical protein
LWQDAPGQGSATETAGYRACGDPFEPTALKYLYVITDQPPHMPDDYAKSMDVLGQALKKPPIAQVYFIVRPDDRKDYLPVGNYVDTRFFDLPRRGR